MCFLYCTNYFLLFQYLCCELVARFDTVDLHHFALGGLKPNEKLCSNISQYLKIDLITLFSNHSLFFLIFLLWLVFIDVNRVCSNPNIWRIN